LVNVHRVADPDKVRVSAVHAAVEVAGQRFVDHRAGADQNGVRLSCGRGDGNEDPQKRLLLMLGEARHPHRRQRQEPQHRADDTVYAIPGRFRQVYWERVYQDDVSHGWGAM
jgi:hypothetical protein